VAVTFRHGMSGYRAWGLIRYTVSGFPDDSGKLHESEQKHTVCGYVVLNSTPDHFESLTSVIEHVLHPHPIAVFRHRQLLGLAKNPVAPDASTCRRGLAAKDLLVVPLEKRSFRPMQTETWDIQLQPVKWIVAPTVVVVGSQPRAHL